MDITEAIKVRHSVRSYTDRRIEGDTKAALLEAVDKVNAESGLHIQLITDEPKAFGGFASRLSAFKNCRNYFAVVAGNDKDEEVGYYGEQLVIAAQQLGLNSCWVAMTYTKSKVPCLLGSGEKLQIAIALGYGETQGVPHKSKPLDALCRTEGEAPAWFRAGMEAAMFAPTAVNQQKFFFTLSGNKVHAKAGLGFYAKLDLGIVKYHFEAAAGKENFYWA